MIKANMRHTRRASAKGSAVFILFLFLYFLTMGKNPAASLL